MATHSIKNFPLRFFIKRLLRIKEVKASRVFRFNTKKESDILCLIFDTLDIEYTQDKNYSVRCSGGSADSLSYFHTDIVWTGSILKGGSKLLKDIPLHRIRKGNTTVESPDRALSIAETHSEIDALSTPNVIEALRSIRVHPDYEKIKLHLPIKSQKELLKQYYDILEHFKFNSASDKKFTANSFKFQLHSLGIKTKLLIIPSNYDLLWKLILDNIYQLLHLERQFVKTDSNCILSLDPQVKEVWPYLRKIQSIHYFTILKNYRPFAYEFLTAKDPEEREFYKNKMDLSYAERFISLPEGLNLSLKESFVYILLNNFDTEELSTITKEYLAYVRNSDNPEYSKGRDYKTCSIQQLAEAATLYSKDKTFTHSSVIETVQMNSDRDPYKMDKDSARRLCAELAVARIKKLEATDENLSAFVTRTVDLNALSRSFPDKKIFVHYCKLYNLLPSTYTSKGSSADVLSYIQKTHPLVRSRNLIVSDLDLANVKLIRNYFRSIDLLPEVCVNNLPSSFIVKQFKYLYGI